MDGPKEMEMIKRIVLGASDPEMAAIEELAREAGVSVVLATVEGGARVSPRDAYAAVAPAPAAGDLWVECAPAAGGRAAIEEAGAQRADHHAPGDPGYGRPPEDFLPASSIGQVVAALARGGQIPPDWHRGDRSTRWYPRGGVLAVEGTSYGPVWRVACGEGGRTGHHLLTAAIPPALVLVAAADHCLAAAYADRCPGVDPAALLAHRATERGAWLATRPTSPEALDVASFGPDDRARDAGWWATAVLFATEATRRRLRDPSLPRVALCVRPDCEDGRIYQPGAAYWSPCGACDPDTGTAPRVLDLRAVGTLPELPTALSLCASVVVRDELVEVELHRQP